MPKYHISKNGKPAKCTATVKPCPLGGDEVHYNSKEEAQKAIDEKNKKENPILASSFKHTDDELGRYLEQKSSKFTKDALGNYLEKKSKIVRDPTGLEEIESIKKDIANDYVDGRDRETEIFKNITSAHSDLTNTRNKGEKLQMFIESDGTIKRFPDKLKLIETGQEQYIADVRSWHKGSFYVIVDTAEAPSNSEEILPHKDYYNLGKNQIGITFNSQAEWENFLKKRNDRPAQIEHLFNENRQLVGWTTNGNKIIEKSEAVDKKNKSNFDFFSFEGKSNSGTGNDHSFTKEEMEEYFKQNHPITWEE